MYDVIIIGAGPAGLSAAVYLARKKLKTLILTKNIGGQTLWSSDIENYLGFTSISGPDLVQKFQEHVMQYKDFVEIKQEEPVIDIDRLESGKFKVKTVNGEYESQSVIITSGKLPKKLNVPGENELQKRGVTYCATCDAPLFKGKDVAVIGGGNAALDAAIQLIHIANKVYIITINEELMGDEILKETVQKANNVEIITKANTKEILGEKFVEKLKLDVNGKEKVIDVKGIFIEIGSLPSSRFADEVEKNRWNEIILIGGTHTNVAGAFAAGDVTDIKQKQTIIAAGEGARAAIECYEYLTKKGYGW